MTADHLSNDQQEQLDRLYDDMRPRHLYPLWEALSQLVPVAPTSPAVPFKWSYGDIRRHLMRAGDLISAEQAERRVLILENPGLAGQSGITPRLYAGLQLVLPGEIAPCHRHSQSALRFIMEGNGAYTAIDGEKAYMSPFDLILTPNGRWHDHGNPSPDPVIWLDGLDIPLVRQLDAGFAERMEEKTHPEGHAPGSALARFGRNMRPLRGGTQRAPTAREPLFHYPHAQWSAALEVVAGEGGPDAHIGHALEFLNPVSGGSVMPTISAHVRLLPAGFETRLRRSTEGAVFAVVEGAGEVEIDGTSHALEQGDFVVVPSWAAARWRARSKLILFCYSDRVVQEKLELYREACE